MFNYFWICQPFFNGFNSINFLFFLHTLAVCLVLIALGLGEHLAQFMEILTNWRNSGMFSRQVVKLPSLVTIQVVVSTFILATFSMSCLYIILLVHLTTARLWLLYFVATAAYMAYCNTQHESRVGGSLVFIELNDTSPPDVIVFQSNKQVQNYPHNSHNPSETGDVRSPFNAVTTHSLRLLAVPSCPALCYGCRPLCLGYCVFFDLISGEYGVTGRTVTLSNHHKVPPVSPFFLSFCIEWSLWLLVCLLGYPVGVFQRVYGIIRRKLFISVWCCFKPCFPVQVLDIA